MTLDELSVKYGTDKGSLKHHYMNFYEQTLPKNPKKILEIGVLSGASLAMWSEYFPDAEIHGLDLFSDHSEEEVRSYLLDECGCRNIAGLHKGSQCDEALLYHIRNDIKPEIIIEDASHNCIYHWVTLYSLITCCEMYIIEDIFTCENEFYRQGLQFEHTVLGSMKTGTFPFKFKLFEDKIAVIYA